MIHLHTPLRAQLAQARRELMAAIDDDSVAAQVYTSLRNPHGAGLAQEEAKDLLKWLFPKE